MFLMFNFLTTVSPFTDQHVWQGRRGEVSAGDGCQGGLKAAPVSARKPAGQIEDEEMSVRS